MNDFPSHVAQIDQPAMTSDEFVTARKALGLTQFEMAIAVGCVPQAVAHWEQGRRGIRFEVAARVRALLSARSKKGRK